MWLWRGLVVVMLLTNITMMANCYAGPKPPDGSATDKDQTQRKSRYGLVQLRQVGGFSDHTFDVHLDSRKLFTLDVDHAFLILQHVFGDKDAEELPHKVL